MRHYKNLLNELLNTSIKKYKTGFSFFSVAMAALPGSDKVQRECEGGETVFFHTQQCDWILRTADNRHCYAANNAC